ncbi:pPIWI_RE module domain-containing protein [Streptomyces milbemycinicus]|uniref:PPIWI_RE module domain-containing protein n=1 Tax=Streptomyces milbemycinicus TaxID=476552 RepID=A0ABW8M5L8_9ACTN
MTERPKRPKISFSGIQFPLFAAKPDEWWPCELHSAAFPSDLLPRLERAWASNPKARYKDRLPTWALTELLLELEPQLLAVSTDLRAATWLRAMRPLADTTVVALALEAWVCGHVAPHQADVPWGEVIGEALKLQWKPARPDLLERGVRPNGTAEPSEAAYKMLATFLAASWVDRGRRLGGRDTDQGSSWIMGPASPDGDRSVFLWPPTRLSRGGEQGYSTHYLRFNVVTLPHDERLLLRVVPHVARMAATQPAYIPRRSQYEPATATMLLYAPSGVLRGTERDTLLRAPVTVTGVKDEMRWTWKPGLPQILSRLPSPDLFPLPDQVRKDPARYASPSEAGGDQAPKPRAFLLHSTGYNYFKDDEDNNDDGTRETGGHPTGTGFQPIDHLTVFEALAPVLEEHHLVPVTPAAEVKPRSRRLPKTRTKAGVEYPIELWHATPRTADAVHLVLTRILGLEHTTTAHDGDAVVGCYRGNEFSVRLRLVKPGLLLAGWPKATDSDPDKRRRARQAALEERARLWQDAFPPEDRPVGCLIELEGPGYYKAARLEDPKKPLKNALPPRCNRLVQIIKPVNRDPNPDAKSAGLHPFENTEVRKQDIERITAALLDLLRQLGRLPTLPPLFGNAPLEVSALWLAHAGPHFVPMLLRMRTDGTATGQLIPSQNHPVEPEIPLELLPAALAEGRGKVKRTDQETLARFLRGALAEDDTHHRLFIARAATLRNKGFWPWLSNQHITADALVWPGVSLTDPGAVPVPRTPASLPGLRIVRVNDDNDELPHGFGIGPAPESAEPAADIEDAGDRQDQAESHLGAAQGQGAADDGASGGVGGDAAEAESVAVLPELPYGWGRFSGVARWNGRGYLAINPRPDTSQLPKGVSKLSGPGNDSKNGQNPTSLHIHASFLQDGDDPDQLALYVQTLRRFHTHTSKATRLPMILHLGKLLEEYIL